MNDPNAVPLDRIPVSTPSIPRFGGLPELPELPGEFAPLPPYRTPTSVTTDPFPSSPPKVVVEPPKAPPKVTPPDEAKRALAELFAAMSK